MEKGIKIRLKMKKALSGEELQDVKVYTGEVLRYDKKQECIYLVLEEGALAELSLDSIYQCDLLDEQPKFCSGRIRERYYDAAGKVLKFEIENGFYKINGNAVDK